MIKGRKFTCITLVIILCTGVGFTTVKIRQQNNPPVVKIVKPENNALFNWDSQVNYEISVTDKEDGATKYDEINTKEVLLEVRYAANKARVQAIIKSAAQSDPPGFMLLRTSNCFNCHNFNGKALGPSFHDIAVKYPATAANIELLVKHIREGSADVWGKDPMPTHPELTLAEIKANVSWILKAGKDATVDYYTGTIGVFHTKPLPVAQKGTYVLIASYVDHGLKTEGSKALKGTDVVVLNGK